MNPGEIPVVQTNRGGQVTYHGPGQVVVYPLIDLQARRLLRQGICLSHRGIGDPHAGAFRRDRAPRGRFARHLRALDDPFSHAALSGPAHPSDPFRGLGKIAALGIKVSRHCTYHGVALNVAMDLEPFSRINPCGYAGLKTTDLSTIGVSASWQEAAGVLGQKLATYLAP